MPRLGFWYDFIDGYTGGLNYVKNLIYAIHSSKKDDVELIIFFGKKTDPKILDEFAPYSRIIQTSILDRKSFSWLLHKVLYRKFGSLWMVNRVLKNHKITVLFSHLGNLSGKRRPSRLINWIPDFQYLHLPELFPGLDSTRKTHEILKDAAKCDLILLSSFDALSDFKSIASNPLIQQTRVLQFVSQPGHLEPIEESLRILKSIQKKYHFNGKYFYLPNQFWKHKNHHVVFEATRRLKMKGKDILIICTGNPNDYRLYGTRYFDELKEYVSSNNLQGHIRMLGLIDYKEVLTLNRHSIAVINPSHFEGWSSSVEEAKSIGKSVILSDIGVHREQNPPNAVYFTPNDAIRLAEILEDTWDHSAGGPDECMEFKGREILKARTAAYGEGYLRIVTELLSSSDR